MARTWTSESQCPCTNGGGEAGVVVRAGALEAAVEELGFGVAHDHAEARPLEHVAIVVVVADCHHLRWWNAELRGERREARAFRRCRGADIDERDPVIELYKEGVDRTLLRENLRRSPEERLRALQALQRFVVEVRRAGAALRNEDK